MSSPRTPHFHFQLTQSPHLAASSLVRQRHSCCVCSSTETTIESFDVEYKSRTTLVDVSQNSLKNISATLHVYLCENHKQEANGYKPKGYDYYSATRNLISHIKSSKNK